MAKTLTDNWKLAENLTDYWHMPWILLSTDKGPDCPFFSTTLPEISNRHAQWEATQKKQCNFHYREMTEKRSKIEKNCPTGIRGHLLCISFISIFVKLNESAFIRTLQVLSVSVLR